MDYDFWRPDLIYIPVTKQNGGLLLRETHARQLRTCLNKPPTAKRYSHRLIEHRTIEPKISNRSRIWSAAANARQQQLKAVISDLKIQFAYRRPQ